ncbi:MAG: VWA domain-containing protein [Bryobacteraceae bacterium]
MLPLAGQQGAPSAPQQEEETLITVDVDLVNVLVSVRDKKGRLIGDLAADDFVVSEEGRPQTIKHFARETDLPLTIGLLVDVSGSQRNLIEEERRAASQFFSHVLRKKDMAFLISFGPEAELLQDYTNSIALLKAGLEDLRASSGFTGLHPGPVPTSKVRGTILYDAVYLAAAEKLHREVGRKAIVLITDGVDVGSRLKLEQAVEAAQKADAIIYSIYYADPGAYSRGGMMMGYASDSALKKMSEETGGRLFKVSRKYSLTDIFDEIQQEMRSQYAIGYSPDNPAKDGGYRRVDIRTANKEYKVQARKGYYAIKHGRH